MAGTKIALNKNTLVEKKLMKADLNGKAVVVVLIDGNVYAMDGVCSHRGGPLEKGVLDGFGLTCPWHGGLFDLKTGKVDARTPWAKDMKTYSVQVDASGDIWLE